MATGFQKKLVNTSVNSKVKNKKYRLLFGYGVGYRVRQRNSFKQNEKKKKRRKKTDSLSHLTFPFGRCRRRPSWRTAEGRACRRRPPPPPTIRCTRGARSRPARMPTLKNKTKSTRRKEKHTHRSLKISSKNALAKASWADAKPRTRLAASTLSDADHPI